MSSKGTLSLVIIFNTVMNTLVDTISQSHHLGYSLSSASQSCNLLQFADDTSLLVQGPAACQALLDRTAQWLEWSVMKPSVPKCCSRQSKHPLVGCTYDPLLSLCSKTIPFIGNSTFRFLGTPVTIRYSQGKAQEELLAKLQSLLPKVDATQLTCHQKLRMFKDAVCPRLSWDLSLTSFPISWVVNKLDSLVTTGS